MTEWCLVKVKLGYSNWYYEIFKKKQKKNNQFLLKFIIAAISDE